MKPVHHPSVPAELSSVKPLGDFVLVRRLSEAETHRLEGGSPVYGPQWRNKGVEGTKMGEVIEVGPGDRLISWSCSYYKCGSRDGYPAFTEYRLTTAKHQPICPNCGKRMDIARLGKDKYAPMHIKLGDIVYYHRAPANNAVINEQEYVFLHEEQHILAVIEKEPPNGQSKDS